MDISLVCWRCGQELRLRPRHFPVSAENLAQMAEKRDWVLARSPGRYRAWCSEACWAATVPEPGFQRLTRLPEPARAG